MREASKRLHAWITFASLKVAYVAAFHFCLKRQFLLGKARLLPEEPYVLAKEGNDIHGGR